MNRHREILDTTKCTNIKHNGTIRRNGNRIRNRKNTQRNNGWKLPNNDEKH